jgi:hypothetical protein
LSLSYKSHLMLINAGHFTKTWFAQGNTQNLSQRKLLNVNLLTFSRMIK